MPQPNQSTRIATHLMLELAEVRKRLEAAEAVVEITRQFMPPHELLGPEGQSLVKAIAAYDELKEASDG